MAAALLLAGALLVWPEGAARDRLRELDGTPGPRLDAWRRQWSRVPAPVLVPALAGVTGLVAAGPLHGCAAALLAATITDLRRRAGVRRNQLGRLGAWERALDDTSSVLRGGAGPELALNRAAEAARSGDPEVAAVLTSAGSHARLGGDVAAALFSAADRSVPGSVPGSVRGSAVPGGVARSGSAHGVPVGDRVAGELAGAWQLATRHGVELAEVVDGLRGDVAARRERAVRVDATLAGPRATAMILTALPGVGVLLGSGFGADPLGVLFGAPLGGVMCLIGAGFLSAGLLWTDRIVAGAAR
ncbi:hypothetical protein [Rhodococcus sp. IEGM 1408]|uniref:type II secretion system F family protein n=1 Tax=Rhodococcus sp. IEGM 1408 TaxID=3082220 RepID=UPI002953E160|nr:hypothetical protein [Rhodococcus sp. IEGM 1408]MDV8002249.1 hypothetical protein [Rhodococcus sp. IEGM 1408]